jgi:ATP-dependent RNA helicase DHX57
MVKKGGQPKGGKPGGGSGKKPTPVTTNGDDSFIVFSNSDKDPKPKRTPNNGEGSSQGASGPALAGESVAPPRVDVKKIIGGASWTGKLPVNLLSEHCQKQKWEKPEYIMVRLI